MERFGSSVGVLLLASHWASKALAHCHRQRVQLDVTYRLRISCDSFTVNTGRCLLWSCRRVTCVTFGQQLNPTVPEFVFGLVFVRDWWRLERGLLVCQAARSVPCGFVRHLRLRSCGHPCSRLHQFVIIFYGAGLARASGGAKFRFHQVVNGNSLEGVSNGEKP